MASRRKVHSDAFVIRKSRVHGRGAFATRTIRKGSRLIEYTGRRITQDQADELYPDNEDEPHHTFLFELDDEWVVDAAVRGNKARWINHSCDPNCEAIIEKRRVFLETMRAVVPGEELTYDYSLTRDGLDDAESERRYACHCGAQTCRGTMLEPRKARKTTKR